MSMLSQTYIGKYYEGSQELSVSTKSIPGQDNDSYVILGESGYGKSVAAQSIVLQKANQSYSVRSLDIHDSSAPEHLFPIFRKSFEHLSSQIDAYNTPIPTTLFEPLHYADGTTESPADLSYTLSNIIARHLRLSRSSTTALSESLEYAISDRDNNPDIFPAILKTLDEFDTKASRSASAHLAPLLRHNVFRNQPIKRHSGIEIINLSKFPPLFQKVIADLLLFDEFRTASQGGQPPRYIHIDEMQNLSIDKDCYLGKILTEGRKYALNVILASQSIREFNASERTMLCQANHKLLFHPALLEVKYYAELLASPQHRAEISDLLRNLEVGQCVFQGPIYIGEDSKPTRAPICVNVSHLEDIASASLSKSST
ncbi:hypothetical protein CGS55_03250 [Faecalibacterium prausnitzii]|uniref:Uncharacterized protein n=1 Tax=Faecalibacterium prausnitzii TaxID=853 RepID=A0A2A7A2E9_9FIRM|nr:ATP-binding protein [Faecalibacterium prausnitzii]PDX73286.1 hypothetical protein CGS55_03250 [Faecalibacterium prausnitzii]